VEESEGRGTNGEAEGRPEGQDGHERTNGSPAGPTSDAGFAEEETLKRDRPVVGEESGEEIANRNDLPRRLEAKDRHIRELYDELAAVRLAVDEARAKVEARELRVRDLEEERERLKERLRELEEEERKRRRWREGQDRRVARLEREIERREENIRNLEDLLQEKENESFAHDREAQDLAARKDAALGDALRRVEGLERDLEEREEMVAGLRDTIETMQDEMDREYETRRRVAGPANRLRAGIDLFNDSEQRQEVASISKSLGQPEVRAVLEEEGAEPAVILTFTWGDVTWRAYAANPGLAVEEPHVYQIGAAEDLSGVHREPSNAHIGPEGRVILGL
jgi:chromosome segregation ATPase